MQSADMQRRVPSIELMQEVPGIAADGRARPGGGPQLVKEDVLDSLRQSDLIQEMPLEKAGHFLIF